MNDEADDLDQADEEILTSTVSDEALEAAADTVQTATFPCSIHTQISNACG
jgi:hypothetical protein